MNRFRKWVVVSHGADAEGTSPVDVRIESRHFTRDGAARVRRPSRPGVKRWERVMLVKDCVGSWSVKPCDTLDVNGE